MRNVKATSTSNRLDIVNKTHSPRNVSSSTSNKNSTPIAGTTTQSVSSQSKTPRTVQSPVHKSPSYYVLKGKYIDSFNDYKENNNSYSGTNHSPLSPDNSLRYQQKGTAVKSQRNLLTERNSDNDHYMISLNVHLN